MVVYPYSLVRRRKAEIELFLGKGQYASKCSGGSSSIDTTYESPKTPTPKGPGPKVPKGPTVPKKPTDVPTKNDDDYSDAPSVPSVPNQDAPAYGDLPQSSVFPVAAVGSVCTASVNNVNAVGKCMATSECGGASLAVPWFCPGTTLDCCVQVAPEAKQTFLENKNYLGKTCQTQLEGKSLSGYCRYTSLCANDGLKSVKCDSCPGPDNIQCCVDPNGSPAPPPPGTGTPPIEPPTGPPEPPTPEPSPKFPKGPQGPKGPKTPKTPKTPSSDPDPVPGPGSGSDDVEKKINALPRSKGPAYQGGRPIGDITTVNIQGKPVEIKTAIAYEKMRQAAAKAGNKLKIISGFRTMSKQKSLYALYKSGIGNLAARPGFSNHQNGIALDLNPREGGNKPWLQKNAGKYGFCRTVPSEDWHYEYLPTNKARCIGK